MNVKLYVYWQAGQWMDNGGEFDVWTRNLSGVLMEDRILLNTVNVEIPDCEIPSKEVIAGKVTESLQAQKREILADTQIKIDKINDKIRQLACLEYKEVEA